MGVRLPRLCENASAGSVTLAPVTDVDPVRDEAASLRRRRDQAYWRLPHAVRQAFDVDCAERVLAGYEARHPGDGRVRRLLELARSSDRSSPEVGGLRDDIHAVAEVLRRGDGHDSGIAYAVARAAYAASAPLGRGRANSDYAPTSASEALNARYLESHVQTGGDADAADVAVRDELRWQTARAEELLRGSSKPSQR
jgi:hypothetical protein